MLIYSSNTQPIFSVAWFKHDLRFKKLIHASLCQKIFFHMIHVTPILNNNDKTISTLVQYDGLSLNIFTNCGIFSHKRIQ